MEVSTMHVCCPHVAVDVVADVDVDVDADVVLTKTSLYDNSSITC